MSAILTIAFIPVLYAILSLAEVVGRVLVRWNNRFRDADVKFSTINKMGKCLPKSLRSELYKFYRVGRRARGK